MKKLLYLAAIANFAIVGFIEKYLGVSSYTYIAISAIFFGGLICIVERKKRARKGKTNN